MKKTTKRLLSVGLCAALALSVGCGLAACGGDDNDSKTPAKPKGVPYWIAGKVKGVEEWSDNAGAFTDETRRFSKGEEDGIFTITLDLWEGDSFKLRYEGKGWDAPEGWQANYTYNFDAEQKADPESKIVEGQGMGGKEFQIAEEGNYTLTLDVTNDTAVVSYKYNGEATVKAPKPVTGITLNKGTLTLEVNATETLTATVAPSNADDKTVTWASSDEAVATVSNTGLVTAVAAGTATITVTSVADNTKKATCELTVAAAGTIVPVTSVTLDKTTAALHIGGTETLTATVAPDNATNKTVAYTSSDENVATVSATGVITAVGTGTATITAQAGDEEATCAVTVAKDLYIVGTGKTPALTGYNPQTTYAAIPEGNAFTENDGEYTLTVNLDNGAAFQVLTLGAGNGGWAGQLGASALADEDTDNNINLASQVGGSSNIEIKQDGQYQITVKLVGTDYKVEVKRLGNATVEFPWSYDIVFHGNWTDETNQWGLVWSGITLNTTALDKDHLTVTADIELTAIEGGSFGIKTAPAGTQDQAAWYNSDKMNADAVNTDAEDPAILLAPGGNAAVKKTGTYNVTVTLDEDGNIVSVVFNSFTPAA